MGFSPDDVWVIGDVVLRWNGSSWLDLGANWLVLPRDTVSGATSHKIFAAWGASPHDVWAVGDGRRVLRRRE